MKVVVDTCVFNWIVEGRYSAESLPQNDGLIATHIQRDEIAKTANMRKRAALEKLFGESVPDLHPTESTVVGIAVLGACKLSNGELLGRIKRALDGCSKKANNIYDALIAEVALVNGFGIVTADSCLAKVMQDEFEYRGLHYIGSKKL